MFKLDYLKLIKKRHKDLYIRGIYRIRVNSRDRKNVVTEVKQKIQNCNRYKIQWLNQSIHSDFVQKKKQNKLNKQQ
jgi:hypothetical protein